MTEKPASTPERPMLQALEQLPDEGKQRERVQQMTAVELQSLVAEMNDAKEMPKIFQSEEMQAALDRRMAETGVKIESNSRLQELRTQFETAKGAALDTAEKGFLKQLTEKGGIWAVVGGAAISVLAFFGFRKAKDLQESLKTKGYLRTAIEGAKDHPIFAAFLTTLGLGTGLAATKYLQSNAGPITEAIAAKAKEMGVPGVDAAKTIADQLRGVIGNGMDLGLKGTVKGLAFAFGGTYDEETGAVTLAHKTLQAPVLIAFEAGVRRRAGNAMVKSSFSQFFIEDRLSAMLRQGQIAGANASEAASYKKLMAKRGLDLLNAPTFNKEARAEVERIVETLAPDLGLDGKALKTVPVTPVEAKQHLTDIENSMKAQSVEEVESFNRLKTQIENDMMHAEENLKKGKYRGSAEEYKKSIGTEMNERTKRFNDELAAKKLGLGKAYEDALNGLHENIGEHARYDLDASTTGRGITSGVLEAATKGTEKFGFKMRKLPGGKYVMGTLIGYSFLPMGLEALAALRPGKEGDAALSALKMDALDAGVGFLPVIGELNDFRAAVTGTDLNGRELDTWTRVTAGAMGGLGTAALAAGFFTGGTSIAGFKFFRMAVASARALKAAKMAENGVEIAQVTQKTIKAIDKATESAKAMEKMYEVTQTQKIARGTLNAVHNAQRGMQAFTYGNMAWGMLCGAKEIYNSTEGVVGSIQKKGLEAIDTAEKIASGFTGPQVQPA